MAGETILTIVGNLTADPELRTTGTGTQVCGFTIASTPRVWNRQANQYEDGQSLFMRCSAWRDLAGHCAQSLSKGMRVIATGRQPARWPTASRRAVSAAGVRPVGQRRQRPHAGHVHHRHRRPGILERTPSWQRKMTLDLSRTRSYPTK